MVINILLSVTLGQVALCVFIVSVFLFDAHPALLFISLQVWKEERGQEGSKGCSATTKVRPP